MFHIYCSHKTRHITPMPKTWRGLPFQPISSQYLELFGQRVYKVPVSVASTCPNRQGLKGMKTCVFCDEYGSAARSDSLTESLEEQISKYTEVIGKKFKAQRFLIYFQSYTSTFLPLKALQKSLEQALDREDVVGLVIGTRPDCISPSMIGLWKSLAQKKKLFIELGAQSFANRDLIFMQRGHTVDQTLRAVDKISAHSELDLSLHLIFGWPEESCEQVRDTALLINQLPVSGVKLHHLHVLRGTHLETLHNQGLFTPITLEDYAEKVGLFIGHLSPKMYIHRLAAFSSRWKDCIAPAWTTDKMGTHQKLVEYLQRRGIYQGSSIT